MRQSIVALMILAMGLACLPAAAQQEFGDEINAAIDQGVAFLWRLQKDDGSWPQYGGGQHSDHGVGATALVVYALLEAGESAQDERIIKALEYLRKAEVSHIYSASLRAVALQVANEQTNDKFVDALESYVPLVLRAMNREGAFGYPTAASATPDNSNTQYAALAMMAFANNDSLRKIRQDYWERLKGYWEKSQNGEDGGWGYNSAGFTGGYYCSVTQPTMTVGGIATLYICEDNLDPAQAIINAEGVTMPVGIQRGLAWMDQNFWWTLNPAQVADVWQPTLNQTVNPYNGQSLGAERISQMQEWYYYYLYGVERAALASGYKYFGGWDWYREGAAILLDSQNTSGGMLSMEDGKTIDLTGSWVRSSTDAGRSPSMLEADTAFALLFLIRGRQPLLFNKLDWGGDWNNRPRDLAKATHWISRGYEFSVNWQIVTVDSSVDDWRDAPFMYISGKKGFAYSAYTVAKLQDYVFKGGTIFSTAQAGGAEFNQTIREFYKAAFPRYELKEVPSDHDFFKTPWAVDPAVAKVYMVHNGVRPLAIHVEGDISLAWQKGDYAAEPWAFDLLANIAIHCCGALYDLPARGVNVWEGVDLGSVGSGTPAGGGGGGGTPAVPGGGGGGGLTADYLYLYEAGQLFIQSPSDAGQTVQLPDGTVITIPQANAPGRTIVYCQPDDCYISVPNALLNVGLPCPVSQDQSFTAVAGSRRGNNNRGQFDSSSQFNAGDDAMWQAEGQPGGDDEGDAEKQDPKWILVLMNQEYTWRPASEAGKTTQSSDGTSYPVPDPDDAGQMTVLCEPMNVYVSVHESLAGYTLETPDGKGEFTVPGGGPTVVVPSDTPLPPPPRPGRAPMPADPYAEVSAAGYPADSVFVIRLKVAGDLANSNPEPLAWPRVAGVIADELDITVAPIGPIEVKDLVAKANELGARLAVFTGTESFSFSEEEREAIKTFVEGGGTLFVDAAGGSKEFNASFTDEINGMFRQGRRSISLRELAVSAPVYQLDGFKIVKVSYRRKTARTLDVNKRDAPALQGIIIDGRTVVIYSPQDITAGLVGFSSGCVDGYSPASAYAIARNVILDKGR